MPEKLHTRETHNKVIQEIAHKVISKVGPMPQDRTNADKWGQKVERIVRQIHERYEGDWERAFELDKALELVKKVGRELGKREFEASRVKRQSKPVSEIVVADTLEEPYEAPVKTNRPIPKPGPVPAKGANAMPRMPSMLEPVVRSKGISGQMAGEQLPAKLGLNLLKQPWVTFGIGLLTGLLIGNYARRWLVR